MIDYNDGKWHTWNGGERPVHSRSAVHVALRSGAISKMASAAGSWYWGRNDTGGEITSFRVITPYIEKLPKPTKRRVVYVINGTAFKAKLAAKIAFPGCKPVKFKACKLKLTPTIGSDMVDYDDGEWHDWNGGTCPVHPKSVIQVSLASGLFRKTPEKAGDWKWARYNDGSDISTFRVVIPYLGRSSKLAKRRVIYVINDVAFKTARAAKTAFPGWNPVKFKACKPKLKTKNESDLCDVSVYLHYEIEKAFLVSTTGDKADAAWIPKSNCKLIRFGKAYVLRLPEWLATDKELV